MQNGDLGHVSDHINMNRPASPYLAAVFFDFEVDALEDGEGLDFGEPEGLMLGSKLDEEIHFEVQYRYNYILLCFYVYADVCGVFQGIFKGDGVCVCVKF